MKIPVKVYELSIRDVSDYDRCYLTDGTVLKLPFEPPVSGYEVLDSNLYRVSVV